ncbi:hypothetical protein SRABI128_05717 [Microbacterium sp. Bi128]|nr:hypothetical protein SRABI128_05717 [Microbacterium sp. Bi128]
MEQYCGFRWRKPMTERSTSTAISTRNSSKVSIMAAIASTPRKLNADTATAALNVATNNRNQRTARNSTMLRMLCRFFAGRALFRASAIVCSSNWASR